MVLEVRLIRMDSLSLSAKYSRSYNDPSTTEIPEASQSVENSPAEKATPEPDPPDSSLGRLLADIQHHPSAQSRGKDSSSRRYASSAKKTPKRASRPQSAKKLISSPLLSGSSPRESITRLSRMTSSAAVTSLYHVISERVRTSGQQSLNSDDLQDIKNFFETEQNQFEQLIGTNIEGKPLTPYEIHRREKVRFHNSATLKKHLDISDKQHREKVQIARKAVKMMKESMEDRLALHVLRLGQKLERQRKAEESQARREQSRLNQSEKDIILSNIRNFYRDKIELLREEIAAEKSREHMMEVERRQALAQAEGERRRLRRAMLEEARKLMVSDTERAQLAGLSQSQLEEELIRLYKRS